MVLDQDDRMLARHAGILEPAERFLRFLRLRIRVEVSEILAIGSLLLLLGGCSDFGFYWQAASGHLDLLSRKQDIQERFKILGPIRNFPEN